MSYNYKTIQKGKSQGRGKNKSGGAKHNSPSCTKHTTAIPFSLCITILSRDPMKRLTKAQIQEGLKAMPIETILLGASTSKQKRLTPKQVEFARQLALGESKAGAYRKSRKTTAKPATASRHGQALAKNDAIQAQVSAFKVALEAMKYQTPAHLRALAIHKITEKVLDESCPPAQQLKALELLGKITEVALFTERREVVQTTNSAEMRNKLMESIKLAIENSQAIDVEAQSADELMAELVGYDPVGDPESQDDVSDKKHFVSEEGVDGLQNENVETPHTHDPQNLTLASEADLHSIPHIGNQPQSSDTNQPRENPVSL